MYTVMMKQISSKSHHKTHISNEAILSPFHIIMKMYEDSRIACPIVPRHCASALNV